MKIRFDKYNKIDGYIKKMQRENELHSKNGVWKWNEIALAAMFIEDAINTNGDLRSVVQPLSYWIALRLKFTTDEITTLIQNYLAGKKDYNYVLYDRTIFEWMKHYGRPYPEAILHAYFKCADKEEINKYGNYYPVNGRGCKLRDCNLLEDGKTIEYYEYKGLFGDKSEDEIKAIDREATKKLLVVSDAKIRRFAKECNMTYEEYVKYMFGDILDE